MMPTSFRRRISTSIILAIAGTLAASTAQAVTPSADIILCQKKIEVHARALAKYAAKKIHQCTEKVDACKLANEIDAADLPTCLATTTATCGATDGLIDTQRTIRGGKVNAVCLTIPLADLQPYVGGLGMLTLPAGCTVASTADLVNCLLDTSRCAAEQQVFRLDPRAQDSLTTAGVAASFPCVMP